MIITEQDVAIQNIIVTNEDLTEVVEAPNAPIKVDGGSQNIEFFINVLDENMHWKTTLLTLIKGHVVTAVIGLKMAD